MTFSPLSISFYYVPLLTHVFSSHVAGGFSNGKGKPKMYQHKLLSKRHATSHQKTDGTSTSDSGLLSFRPHPGLFLCIILVSSFCLFLWLLWGFPGIPSGFARIPIGSGVRSRTLLISSLRTGSFVLVLFPILLYSTSFCIRFRRSRLDTSSISIVFNIDFLCLACSALLENIFVFVTWV
jgi:hypothetical protein